MPERKEIVEKRYKVRFLAEVCITKYQPSRKAYPAGLITAVELTESQMRELYSIVSKMLN